KLAVTTEREGVAQIRGGTEKVDAPAVGRQRVAKIGLRYRAHRRDHTVDVAVGEAPQVQPGAGPRRAIQTGDVGLLAVFVEAVIQRAVEDGVESTVVPGQLCRVGDVECHRDT